MLFAGREVRIGKNCARGLEYGPRAVLKSKGSVFPNMDQPRPANNVFIFFSLENYLQQFHTVCMRLTFRSSKPVLLTEVFKEEIQFSLILKLSNK